MQHYQSRVSLQTKRDEVAKCSAEFVFVQLRRRVFRNEEQHLGSGQSRWTTHLHGMQICIWWLSHCKFDCSDAYGQLP